MKYTLYFKVHKNQEDTVFQSAKNQEYIHQASFDHVKVGPTAFLALRNLWLNLHMFLDILELRVEN